MSIRIECAGLQVDTEIHALLEKEILPGTGLEAASFWRSLADIVARFTPRNRELLAIRDDMQASISAWHKANPGPIRSMAKYRKFLQKIGYLVPVPAKVKATAKVKAKIRITFQKVKYFDKLAHCVPSNAMTNHVVKIQKKLGNI